MPAATLPPQAVDLLEKLIAQCDTIWITKCADPDWPRFPTIAIQAIFAEEHGSKNKTATATSAHEALERLLGIEAKFLCKKCGELKARRMFTFDMARPTGRHPYCLTCNAKRSAAYRNRKAVAETELFSQLGLQTKKLKRLAAT